MLAFILGTRPEIIKLAPVIRAAENHAMPFTIIHTGQHYSPELDHIFFQQLNLPRPAYNLHVGSASHGIQLARMMEKLERLLQTIQPRVVIVQGDTNTVLAGALITARLGIPLAHVEAGLRSRDMRMPEEQNRIIADHLSTFLYPPTEAAMQNLRKENLTHQPHGKPERHVLITGNTIVDAVQQHLPLAEKDEEARRVLKEHPRFILLTLHRPENTDDASRLKGYLQAVASLAQQQKLRVVFPIHPRTEKTLRERQISLPKPIIPLPPLPYLTFLTLLQHARLVLTDSGGVQEEACILKKPTLTLRTSTERPETLRIGCNIITPQPEDLIPNAKRILQHTPEDWENPYGDGRAGERIIAHLREVSGNIGR